MNHCAHGHPTPDEIRRLPFGFPTPHGTLAVCRAHWAAEMRDRRARATETRRYAYQFPAWPDLALDQPRVDGP